MRPSNPVTSVTEYGTRVTRGSAPNLDSDPQVAVAGLRVRITRALDGTPIYWGAESDPVEHAGHSVWLSPHAHDRALELHPWLRRRER